MDLHEIHHFFQMFDHDGDGKITKQELSKSLASLGMVIPEKGLEHMIKHIDEDGDGCVNMEEFEKLYETIMEERDEEEDIKEAFNVFDKNGDGFITVDELSTVLMSLGLRQGRTIEDCQLKVKKVDVDGDGMVNYAKFRQMMKGGGFAAMGTN
ncbi:calmodulin-like protein 3 [Rutidosis leptorrhynchoides]|uniref:calmodulin-like protein 3 n=1 Tax=Rutidosis leptorrhynchoides TaxID=125765 RepID=UPI003A9967A9